METTTFELNPEQTRAVHFGDGPLRIIAGAGTGKTSTLTERIRHLVQTGRARPSEILALTFTRKATAELEDRIGKAIAALPEANGERVDIDTYNAFGGRVVAEHGHLIGLPPEPLILTTAEAWIVLWRVLSQVEFRHIELLNLRGTTNLKSPLFDMLQLGSRLCDEVSTLDELDRYLATAEVDDATLKLRDYAGALRAYEARKREIGAIDYGDQIALACQLLANEVVAKTYHERYRYLLVDEFQDTNYAQSILVQRLAGSAEANVCVVGDPNQAIYAFRGASPDNIDRFSKVSFPGAETISLDRNFRSTAEILSVANAIWAGDPGEFRGNLRAGEDQIGPRPRLVSCDALEDEIAYIADAILARNAAGMAFGKIAIIARKNKVKDAIYQGLRDRRIPCEVFGGTSLYETPEVRELISFLRAIGNPLDEASLAHVLCTEQWGMDEAGLYDLAQQRVRGETLATTARRIASNEGGATTLRSCLAELDRLGDLSYRVSLSQLVEEIVALRKGGYDELELMNVQRFAGVVRAFSESRVEHPQLADLLVYLELLLRADPEEEAEQIDAEESNTVKIMTSHASKGLEWPVVFVCGANKNDFVTKASVDILPAALSHPVLGQPRPEEFSGNPKAFATALKNWNDDRHRREELRVLYVALTRAKGELTIIWSKSHPDRKRETTLLPALEPAVEHCQKVTAGPAPPIEGRIPTFREIVPRLLSPVTSQLADEPNSAALAESMSWRWERDGGKPGIVPQAIDSFYRRRAHLQEQVSIIRAIEARNSAATKPAKQIHPPTSYTQLERYKRCPHLYYLHYVAHMPSPPQPRTTAIGTAFHEAIARESKARQHGKPVSDQQFREWFETELDLAGPAAQSIEGDGGGSNFLANYRNSVDATATPLLVEAEFVLKLGEVTVKGAIDRVHRLPDGTIEIVDYKTDRTPRTEEQVRHGWQLPIYLLACREVFPEIAPSPTRASMFFVRANTRITVDYTADELETKRAEIEAAGLALRDVTWSQHHASPETCKLCEYRTICSHVAK